jgi:hypothetical protein
VHCGVDFVIHAYHAVPMVSARKRPGRAPCAPPRPQRRIRTGYSDAAADCIVATSGCHVLIVHGPAFAKWKCKTPACEVTRRLALLTSQVLHHAAPGKALEKREECLEQSAEPWRTANLAHQHLHKHLGKTNISAAAGEGRRSASRAATGQ